MIQKSEDLQGKEEEREEYFKIKSGVQMKNAQVEREKLKVEKQLAFLAQKRTTAQKELDGLEAKLEQLANVAQLKKAQTEADQQLKEKQSELKKKTAEQQAKVDQTEEAVTSIKELEVQLLEKEFELKELEIDKQVRSQDAKLI